MIFHISSLRPCSLKPSLPCGLSAVRQAQGWAPPLGSWGSQGLVLALGSLNGLLGATPSLVHCLAPLQVQFSELLFLNFKRGPSFTSHLGVGSRSPRLSLGAPDQRQGKCWEESQMPAGGNENQQACERGLVCAPDTKQAQIGRGGSEIQCPHPS